MIRICQAFNVYKADSFVTPTGIMLSIIEKNGETYSAVRRISVRTVNLEKISMVNDLSRSIIPNKLSLTAVENCLEEINNTPAFSRRILLLASSCIAGFFTLVFGGTFRALSLTDRK